MAGAQTSDQVGLDRNAYEEQSPVIRRYVVRTSQPSGDSAEHRPVAPCGALALRRTPAG